MNLLCLLGLHHRCRDRTAKRGRAYQSRCVRCDRLMVREEDGRWRAIKILRLEKKRAGPDRPRPRSALWRGSPDGSAELAPPAEKRKRR